LLSTDRSALIFSVLFLITLTPLEPSTSHTPHYAVPPSFCRRTLARCFAAPLQALSPVSTRILSISWTPPYRHEMAPSPSARCLVVERRHCHPLFAHYVTVRETPSLSARCLAVRRVHRYPLAV